MDRDGQCRDPDRFHRSGCEGAGPACHTERVKVLGLQLSPQERRQEAPGDPRRIPGSLASPGTGQGQWISSRHSRGADPASEKTAHKKVETVNQLLDRCLTDYAPAESKWTAEVRRIFKKDVRPAIGGHKITAVTKADILAILNAVKDRGAGVTSNRTLAAVRKAFNWAVNEGYLKASPVQGIGPIDCLDALRVAVAGKLLPRRRDTAAPRLPCGTKNYWPNRPPRPTRQWLDARRLWSAWAIVSVGTAPSSWWPWLIWDLR
jgi:hypothetical protein